MQTETITITFITSNKSGTLSSIVMRALKLDLKMSKNWTESIDDNYSRLFVILNGVKNCSESQLIEYFESNPKIQSIENISFNDNKNASVNNLSSKNTSTRNRTTANTEPTKLHALDYITEDILKITEKKMSALFGPVANLLVESAAKKTRFVGELYLILSEELNAEEKDEFLASVSGLKEN